MKILDIDKVNTDFNLYHKWLVKWYKCKVIRKFNKMLKNHLKAGRAGKHIYVDEVTIDNYNTGISRKALDRGNNEAIMAISEKYPVITVNRGIIYNYIYEKAFDISQKEV